MKKKFIIFLLHLQLIGGQYLLAQNIAILPFSPNGVDSTFANYVTDLVQRAFVENSSCKIIERQQILKILQEHKLQLSGLTDEQQTSIGKLLPVEYIVVGSISKIESPISDTGYEYVFYIKLIEIKTGRIMGSISDRDMGYLSTGDFDMENFIDTIVIYLKQNAKQHISGFLVQSITLPPEYRPIKISINVMGKNSNANKCIGSGNSKEEILKKTFYIDCNLEILSFGNDCETMTIEFNLVNNRKLMALLYPLNDEKYSIYEYSMSKEKKGESKKVGEIELELIKE